MHPLKKILHDKDLYKSQLRRLVMKAQINSSPDTVEQDGVSLSTISLDENSAVRALIATVKKGEYRFKPAYTRTLVVAEKEREVFLFRISDLWLHGVVAQGLLDLVQPQLSPQLFSYLKGKNWWIAVSDFANYVRAHTSALPLKERGLFVLRKDVAKYTDSIPVGLSSPVWGKLRQTFNIGEKVSDDLRPYWKILEDIIRCEAFTEDTRGHFSKLVGVPTGSPISTTLFNYYLKDMDCEIEAIPDSYYARYGDDLIFAHRDPKVVEAADDLIGKRLAELRLRSNVEKNEILYFNGAGKSSPLWDRAQGAQTVKFLGAEIHFDSTVSLSRKKSRKLLRTFRKIIENTVKNLIGSTLDQKGRIICEVLNESLDPFAPRAHKSANILRTAVTNRTQLKQLDYQIALQIAEVLSKTPGPRAFREIPYKTIRRKWRLTSIYHARNMWARELR